jgi:hypothetical protein
VISRLKIDTIMTHDILNLPSVKLAINMNILNIIQRPVFNLDHDVSETGFCLRLEVEHTHLGPVDRASLCLRTPATLSMGFIEPTEHKPSTRVNISAHVGLHFQNRDVYNNIPSSQTCRP